MYSVFSRENMYAGYRGFLVQEFVCCLFFLGHIRGEHFAFLLGACKDFGGPLLNVLDHL